MNESQARQLAEVYESMGYQTNYEQTGGGVYLVTVFGTDRSVIQFGIDTVTKVAGPLLADWPMTITLA